MIPQAVTLAMAVVLSQSAPVMTLEQALADAETNNNDLKVAQARLQQAQQLSARVWANYLPTITVGAAYTRNSAEAVIPFATSYVVRNVGAPTGAPFDPTQPPSETNLPGGQTTFLAFPDRETAQEITIQPFNQWGAQAQFNQAILAPALFPAIRAAYLGEQVAALNIENARREVLFGVAQLYFGVAGLKQAVAVQERLLEINRAHEKDARIRYDAGALPRVALLRAEIDRARSEQDLKRAQNALAGMKLSLGTLLDRAGPFDVTAPQAPAIPADVTPLREAVSQRPDLKAAQAQVALTQSQRLASWLRYAPSLGANGVYRYSNVGGFTGENASWAVSLGLNWTLLDGGLREAEVREAGAKVAEARAAQRSAELKASEEFSRALLELDSARANKVKAEEQLNLARESRKLVGVNYEAGGATYLEVTDANSALLNAEVGAVSEALNESLAALRLLKAAGRFAVAQ